MLELGQKGPCATMITMIACHVNSLLEPLPNLSPLGQALQYSLRLVMTV